MTDSVLDMNTQSWQAIIFHLSEAMNHVLSKTLFMSDCNCPNGVAASLCDLLGVISKFSIKYRLNNPLTGNIECDCVNKRNHSVGVEANNSVSENLLKENNSSDSFIVEVHHLEFLLLSKKMINGTCNKGYYCHFCKKQFLDDDNWKAHFSSPEVHQNVKITYDNFGSCATCKFRIFAKSSEVKRLIEYHESCHQSQQLSMEDSSNNSLEEEASDDSETVSECSTQSETPDKYHEARGPIKCELALNKKEYDSFKRSFRCTVNYEIFCTEINNKAFPQSFYCRPCDYCSTDKQEWENHCVEKGHLRFLNSEKFKNYKGVCDFCSLEILGTKPTIHQHMLYHTGCHGNKHLSYKCYRISSNDNTKLRKPKSLLQRRGHKGNEGPEDTLLQTSYKTAKSFDDNEKIKCKVIGLYHNQKRDKTAPYKWYCLPCNSLANKSSVWIDHLSSFEHRDRQTKKDENLNYPNCNISFFGNKDFILSVLNTNE